MLKIFKIVRSTSGTFVGKRISLNNVTTEEIQEVLKQRFKVIKISEEKYMCLNEHNMIILKKEIK